MKPPVFDYYDPRTLDEALELLRQFGPEAKVLAGGQSLMPLLNMRLVTPAQLIDLNRLNGLSYVRTTPEAVHIGALTRQYAIEHHAVMGRTCPLLVEALHHVGYAQIRHRGTLGGSLAHADPAAELPAVMLALDARFELRSQAGTRSVSPEDFYLTYLTTALEPEELLCDIRLPLPPPRTGWSFQEVARVAGAFAIVGVAAVMTLDEAGRCLETRLGFTGIGPVPQRAARAEAALRGEVVTLERLQQAAQVADAELDPDSDVHASAAYRRQLAKVLAQRTLQAAWERAGAGGVR
jgi:CO/xanthine dehydrogenase FAD-binding subunit